MDGGCPGPVSVRTLADTHHAAHTTTHLLPAWTRAWTLGAGVERVPARAHACTLDTSSRGRSRRVAPVILLCHTLQRKCNGRTATWQLGIIKQNLENRTPSTTALTGSAGSDWLQEKMRVEGVRHLCCASASALLVGSLGGWDREWGVCRVLDPSPSTSQPGAEIQQLSGDRNILDSTQHPWPGRAMSPSLRALTLT